MAEWGQMQFTQRLEQVLDVAEAISAASGGKVISVEDVEAAIQIVKVRRDEKDEFFSDKRNGGT